jgi:hypothetical protein
MISSKNPYVGPRTFSRAEGDRFFGREYEARELLSLVISERLVLLYGQSGAGKSSLINARLIPQLQARDFAVLPVGRVSGEIPEGVVRPLNIFAFNLMLSLDQQQGSPHRFTHLPLTEFLAGLTSDDGETYYYSNEAVAEAGETCESIPYVLLIDQFEEFITTHPDCWAERDDFFRQVSQAIAADEHLWIVLSLREDYLAALDPYANLTPNHLRARFQLPRLNCEAALEAITRPAALDGRPYAPGVAETLVDNLCRIRVLGRDEWQPGQFIEPVQLQVVCYQLWENVKERPINQISQADLPLNYVSQALRQFYETVIERVAQESGVAELTLRQWLETKLITEANSRGTVYRGEKRTGGLVNEAADLLVQHYLLRTDMRAGGTWYELTHDRFIEPIRLSNASWERTRLKRWSDTSFGLALTLLTGALLALGFRFFADKE